MRGSSLRTSTSSASWQVRMPRVSQRWVVQRQAAGSQWPPAVCVSAQIVVKQVLEPQLEPILDQNS